MIIAANSHGYSFQVANIKIEQVDGKIHLGGYNSVFDTLEAMLEAYSDSAQTELPLPLVPPAAGPKQVTRLSTLYFLL